MGYKRKPFGDKTIVAAAAAGVLAVSAIVGGVLLNTQDKEENRTPIVDLSENETTGQKSDVADRIPDKEDESGLVVSDQKDVTAVKPGDKTSDATDNNVEPSDEKTQADNNDQLNVADENNKTDSDADGEKTDEASGLVGISFDVSSTLVWPVEGNILIDYDMENTVYFATLDLYKCSDAVCIQSEVGTPVYAGHACVIEEISYNSEIGNNVTVSMGNGYMVTYGQLKDVQVEKGEIIEEGDLIGYVGNPTKYYSVEGANLYIKMTHNGEPVDPLDYLDYE